MGRFAPIIAVFLVCLAACSAPSSTTSEEPDRARTAASSTTVTATVVAPSTSTSATVPETAAPPPTTESNPPPSSTTEPTSTSTTTDVVFSVATHGLHPAPVTPSTDAWFGSGCSPGADTLPDGVWWGYITAATETSITFDLACLRWIDDPDDDAIEGGRWDIRNTTPRTRSVPIHPQAQATCRLSGCPPTSFPYIEWVDRAPILIDSPDSGVWLYVNDGAVTEVGEDVLAG